MGVNEQQRWQIGALANRTGLSVRALRHYDELGLLQRVERDLDQLKLSFLARDVAGLGPTELASRCRLQQGRGARPGRRSPALRQPPPGNGRAALGPTRRPRLSIPRRAQPADHPCHLRRVRRRTPSLLLLDETGSGVLLPLGRGPPSLKGSAWLRSRRDRRPKRSAHAVVWEARVNARGRADRG